MNSKKILMIQSICMYLIQIPFYILFILIRIPFIEVETLMVFLLICIIAHVIMVPILIISLICAIKQLIKEENVSKYTLKIKLILLPWYIINIIYTFVCIVGGLNPFLFMAIPLVLLIITFVTYLYMLSTSIHLVIYVIKKINNKEIELTPLILISIIMMFIFCLDIIGTYLLDKQLNN